MLRVFRDGERNQLRMNRECVLARAPPSSVPRIYLISFIILASLSLRLSRLADDLLDARCSISRDTAHLELEHQDRGEVRVRLFGGKGGAGGP